MARRPVHRYAVSGCGAISPLPVTTRHSPLVPGTGELACCKATDHFGSRGCAVAAPVRKIGGQVQQTQEKPLCLQCAVQRPPHPSLSSEGPRGHPLRLSCSECPPRDVRQDYYLHLHFGPRLNRSFRRKSLPPIDRCGILYHASSIFERLTAWQGKRRVNKICLEKALRPISVSDEVLSWTERIYHVVTARTLSSHEDQFELHDCEQ